MDRSIQLLHSLSFLLCWRGSESFGGLGLFHFASLSCTELCSDRRFLVKYPDVLVLSYLCFHILVRDSRLHTHTYVVYGLNSSSIMVLHRTIMSAQVAYSLELDKGHEGSIA